MRSTISNRITWLMALLTCEALVIAALFYYFLDHTARDPELIELSVVIQNRVQALKSRWNAFSTDGTQGARSLRPPAINFERALNVVQHGGKFRGYNYISPPHAIAALYSDLRQAWMEMKPFWMSVADSKGRQTQAVEEVQQIQERLPKLAAAADNLQLSFAAERQRLRSRVMAVLYGIGALNLLLVLTGSWLTRHYIARPILLMDESIRSTRTDPSDAATGLLLLSADLRVISADRFVRRKFRLKGSQILGMPIERIFPISGLHQKLLEAVGNRSSRRDLVISVPGPQMECVVRFIVHRLSYSGRSEGCILLIVEDITELQNLRETSVRLEQHMREIVCDLQAIVWEADPASWQFSFVSERAEVILGHCKADWLNQPNFWSDHLHPDDALRARAFREANLAGGQDHAQEYRMIAADGHAVWLRDSVRIIHNGEGSRCRLRGVMMDVTDRHRLEEQLRHAQKMEAVGQLAGGIAHDFNNLLTVITGYSRLMLDKMDVYDPLRDSANEVIKAGERASLLTRQLLAFSRRQLLQPKVLDLNRIITNAEKMVRRLIGEHIELVLALEPELGQVLVDPGQVEQIIVNLVVNARDAMTQGGRIVIETVHRVLTEDNLALDCPSLSPGSYVVLAVHDNGCGMDPETQCRIFEPFFTTKPVGKGTGLGLSMVYGIVKQSGGDISVRSKSGCGATFSIYFPRIQKPTAEDIPGVVPAGRTEVRKLTVLLVEDEPAIRELVYKMLEVQGHVVLAASDAKQAWQLYEEFGTAIDLLLTDVIMPLVSGRALADRLLAIQPNIKILFISGYSDEVIAEQGALTGPGIAFLPKPFTAASLDFKIRKLISAQPSGRDEKSGEADGSSSVIETGH